MEPLDWGQRKRAAAQRLLSWPDTAVIQDASVILVSHGSSESVGLLCDSLAQLDGTDDFEAQETILSEMSAAWKSGAVDVHSLLVEVRQAADVDARRGAAIALDWLAPAP